MTIGKSDSEIDVHQLAEHLQDQALECIILDVRQPWELRLARLDDARVISLPLNLLTSQAHQALPTPAPDHQKIFVLCHHGLRSGAATRWLRSQGWENSYNIRGGLDSYQRTIDPAVGSY